MLVGRLKSVKNIEKITKVRARRETIPGILAHVPAVHEGRRFHQARPSRASHEVGQDLRRCQPGYVGNNASRPTENATHIALAELYNQAGVESAPDAKVLYVAITSDRGLCGGIHSSVSKAAKKALLAHPEARVVVCGDKPKAQLSRMMPQQMALSFNQIGKDIPTFAEAAAIADEITTNGGEWDELKIIYNKYISAISYEATTVTVAGPKALAEAAGFKAYEMEEDVSKDLTEFALANIIFQALVEGHAAEQSARRTAMENASNVGHCQGMRWGNGLLTACARTPTI